MAIRYIVALALPPVCQPFVIVLGSGFNISFSSLVPDFYQIRICQSLNLFVEHRMSQLNKQAKFVALSLLRFQIVTSVSDVSVIQISNCYFRFRSLLSLDNLNL